MISNKKFTKLNQQIDTCAWCIVQSQNNCNRWIITLKCCSKIVLNIGNTKENWESSSDKQPIMFRSRGPGLLLMHNAYMCNMKHEKQYNEIATTPKHMACKKWTTNLRAEAPQTIRIRVYTLSRSNRGNNTQRQMCINERLCRERGRETQRKWNNNNLFLDSLMWFIKVCTAHWHLRSTHWLGVAGLVNRFCSSINCGCTSLMPARMPSSCTLSLTEFAFLN